MLPNLVVIGAERCGLCERVCRRLGVPHMFAILRRAPAWAGLPLTSPLPPTVLTPELGRRLESALAEDAARFRALTGMRFDSWSV